MICTDSCSPTLLNNFEGSQFLLVVAFYAELYTLFATYPPKEVRFDVVCLFPPVMIVSSRDMTHYYCTLQPIPCEFDTIQQDTFPPLDGRS